jgi:hypothetical protein
VRRQRQSLTDDDKHSKMADEAASRCILPVYLLYNVGRNRKFSRFPLSYSERDHDMPRKGVNNIASVNVEHGAPACCTDDQK